ncbi:MAG: DUF1918 domain-containing protein, partial [Gaiellaceae bacterium]|nr:DUF1918 domain-containing protein [Gaiellaceae bacterium]
RGVPHPATLHVRRGRPMPLVRGPVVVKPRFGSWGRDVVRCEAPDGLVARLEALASRPWFRRHGALVQRLVRPRGYDLRVLVAGGSVAGAVYRIAAVGEWRTNVALGGRVVQAELPAGTDELALAAARALGIDFVGVDLLPRDGGWTILELNGAVDYDRRYALPDRDPYLSALDGLGVAREATRAGTLQGEARRKEVAMAKTVRGKPARPGDEIVITGHSVGESPKTAVILEVLGEPDHVRFRVRWEDGHESIFYPGEDAVIRRPQGKRRAKAPA